MKAASDLLLAEIEKSLDIKKQSNKFQKLISDLHQTALADNAAAEADAKDVEADISD